MIKQNQSFAMVQTPTKSLTLEEFLKLPETKPFSEYIDGKIIQKPMLQGKHSIIQGEFIRTINTIFKPQKIALALPELRCTFGGRSIIPDVAVLNLERIPQDKNGDIANIFDTYPDWTIEILSPDQNQTKVINNILHCLKYGCHLGWLIDPDVRSILVFPAGKQPDFLENDNDSLPVPEFLAELKLTLGDIFDWLKL